MSVTDFKNKHQWLQKYELLLFNTIDSTNMEARRISEIIENDAIICAQKQVLGRGKELKKWFSPEGNLYFSLLKLNKFKYDELSFLPFTIAVAIGDVIKKYISKDDIIQYKWPNDILVNGKKICGILIETKIINRNSVLPYVIIGAGLNLLFHPDNLSYEATSIDQLSNKKLDRIAILGEIISELDSLFLILKQNGFTYIKEKWMNQAYQLNSLISVKNDKNIVSGVFCGIDEYGGLKLKMSGGDVKYINSGEIFAK